LLWLFLVMNKNNSEKEFRDQLENQHNFPGIYTFKFILPAGKIDLIKVILPEKDIIQKPSRNGNYISVTARLTVESPDDVIRIYKEASQIEGIIKL